MTLLKPGILISCMLLDGHETKGFKTLRVSRTKHGPSHVTIIDMLTLQFTTFAACPCKGHHAFKKQLTCSHGSHSHLQSHTVLLNHDICDIEKDSGHYHCHCVKCNIPKGMWEFRWETLKPHMLQAWIRWVNSCIYVAFDLPCKDIKYKPENVCWLLDLIADYEGKDRYIVFINTNIIKW